MRPPVHQERQRHWRAGFFLLPATIPDRHKYIKSREHIKLASTVTLGNYRDSSFHAKYILNADKYQTNQLPFSWSMHAIRKYNLLLTEKLNTRESKNVAQILWAVKNFQIKQDTVEQSSRIYQHTACYYGSGIESDRWRAWWTRWLTTKTSNDWRTKGPEKLS